MSSILIINASKSFGASEGKLNELLAETARDVLTNLDHEVHTTRIEDGYEAEDEVQKILRADTIIYQTPAWWFGEPWHLKKYIDEVFTFGHGHIFFDDGRTRADPTRKYGTGGKLQGKRYLLSATWNAPEEAFTEPGQFFDGMGPDVVYYHFHKTQQFVGLSRLPTFLCYDVIKNPAIESDVARYRLHLQALLGR
ncbi:NAD(P)H-dependent oxidoreductase [Paraburkholderia strydomiana]|uniref:NAD(P)H-dependent oxidoreductase n=1 Tax=Paraburkholderia strydomiana TaxID=1245417 RepID=UPI0038BDAF3A